MGGTRNAGRGASLRMEPAILVRGRAERTGVLTSVERGSRPLGIPDRHPSRQATAPGMKSPKTRRFRRSRHRRHAA
ncbi:hypothetical protein LG3211_4032 [Lysobacter gummosus]|nr:hypothetical protein LG3211_4032 [Lysobacter gummosus]